MKQGSFCTFFDGGRNNERTNFLLLLHRRFKQDIIDVLLLFYFGSIREHNPMKHTVDGGQGFYMFAANSSLLTALDTGL